MSLYGFEAKSGTDGSVVLSDSALNGFFIGKATYQGYYYENNYGKVYWYTLVFRTPAARTDRPPMWFLWNVVGDAGRMKYHDISHIGGGIWEIVFKGIGKQVTQGAPPVPNVPHIYCFTASSTMGPSSATYGMRLYNAAGNLTYDSGWAKTLLIKKAGNIVTNDGSTFYFGSGLTKPAYQLSYNVFRHNKAAYQYFYTLFAGFSNATTLELQEHMEGCWYDNTPSQVAPFGQGETLSVALIDGADFD